MHCQHEALASETLLLYGLRDVVMVRNLLEGSENEEHVISGFSVTSTRPPWAMPSS